MKHVTILVPQGNANLSSITGSFEILSSANAHWRRQGRTPPLDICIAGAVPELQLSAGFVSLHPASLTTIAHTDLIIIPSADYHETILTDNEEMIAWIKARYLAGAEVASMCTGAFLLAATGLLDGKACSTHWNVAAEFQRLFPKVSLQIDRLIVSDNGLYTNGGAYSFLNLLLLLVEKYFDRPTAIYCSKIFQIDIARKLQSPFLIFQAQKNHADAVVNQAQTYIEEKFARRISFTELASRLAVSRRNFDRRFAKATGNSPVEYLQRVRVELAKSLLEQGRKTVFEVMDDVGYADDKAFREVFRKITGMAPLEYKARFA